MFDGGGSPSLMVNGVIKRQGRNNLSPLLLVYKGSVCQKK